MLDAIDRSNSPARNAGVAARARKTSACWDPKMRRSSELWNGSTWRLGPVA
jgi:hypothetical protein